MGPLEMGDSTDAKDVLEAAVSSTVVTSLGSESGFDTGADKCSALFFGSPCCGPAEVTAGGLC